MPMAVVSVGFKPHMRDLADHPVPDFVAGAGVQFDLHIGVL